MSIVTFPCEYLVVEFFSIEKLCTQTDLFAKFCKDKDITPLFISHKKILTPLVINDNNIQINDKPTSEESELNVSIVNQLIENKLSYSGIICFRVKNSKVASTTFLHLDELYETQHVCVDDINYLGDNNGVINLVHVTYSMIL